MGKKKPKASSSKPEDIKELGNKAFALQKYQEAIDYYTQAIEMTAENPNHIYFANRANCKLELRNYNECIEDCESAIKIDPKYQKSYLRKAKALHIMAKFNEALDTIKVGLNLDPDNQDCQEIESQVNQEIEADGLVSKDHPSRKKFEDLLQWMEKGGCVSNKMRLRYYESTHRGVHAACNIKVGDTLLQVPYDQLITMQLACETPVGKQMKEVPGFYNFNEGSRILHYGEHNFLAVYLLTEIYKKRDDPNYVSRHAEFLAILPEDMDDFPACFSDEEVAFLKGSSLHQQVLKRKKNHRADYDLICSKVPDFKQFSFKDYVYCNLQSASRAFELRTNQDKCMVPYADMLNHKEPMETKWGFDIKKNCFYIEALQNIPFGAQVHDSYGTVSTSRLFLNYGFVLYPHHGDDIKLVLKMNAKELDIHYDLKCSLVTEPWRKQFFMCTKDLQDVDTLRAIGFARFVTHSNADTSPLYLARKEAEDKYLAEQKARGVNVNDMSQKFLFDGIKLSFKGVLPSYDIENEVAAWQLLKREAAQFLTGYPTSVQEDSDLLEKDDKEPFLGFNKRNCVLYRRGEKDICHYLMFCADKAQELSKLSKKEAKQAINMWEGHDERCEPYFKDVFSELLS